MPRARPFAFVKGAIGLIAVVALWDQLRRPAGQHTWHGRVAGVPYDFRPPTLERAKAKLWDRSNPSLLAPHLWGIGWTVNLYRLAHPLEEPAKPPVRAPRIPRLFR